MNLATGFIAPESNNFDKTAEVGQKIVDMKTFQTKKKDLAIQIPTPNINNCAANDVNISCSQIDHQVYLQRVLIVLQDKKDEIKFDEVIRQYELSSISPSLVHTKGFMRSNTKSKLGHYLASDKSIVRTTEAYELMKNNKTEVVFDGGATQQRVGWPKNATFSQIITCYANPLSNMCRN